MDFDAIAAKLVKPNMEWQAGSSRVDTNDELRRKVRKALRAAFAAGREAMRSESAECARSHADIHTRRGETDGGAHSIGYCRGRHDVALDIARAIRALPALARPALPAKSSTRRPERAPKSSR